MVEMTVAAGHAPGLRALLVLGMRVSSTGGRFYLGRDDVHVHLGRGEPDELLRALLAGSTYTHALVGPGWRDLEALEAVGDTRGPSFGEFSLWAR